MRIAQAQSASDRQGAHVHQFQYRTVRIPEAVLGVERWECRVSSARMLAPFIRELVLEPPAGRTMNFRAGGYVQVECPPHQLRFADFTLDAATRAEWQRLGLTGQTSATTTTLTRAYSLANYPGEGPGLPAAGRQCLTDRQAWSILLRLTQVLSILI